MSNFLVLIVASLGGAMLQIAGMESDVSTTDSAEQCDQAVGATVMTWIEVHQDNREIERRRLVCHDRPDDTMIAPSPSGAQR